MMKSSPPLEVIQSFLVADQQEIQHFQISSLGGGLINYTYKLTSSIGKSYLLQSINATVFKDPVAVQENYIQIWNYNNKLLHPQFLATPIFLPSGLSLLKDDQDRFWRSFRFVEGSCMKPLPENEAQCRYTAETFAAYTAQWKNFDTNILKVILPNFHHLSLRFHQFEQALIEGKDDRIARANKLIQDLKSRNYYSLFFDWMLSQPHSFPQRVMHHDAKIANMLFDESNGNVMGAVDFDTLMPGYFFSDLGDMIRSMACSADENDTQFESLHIKKNYYQKLVQGYVNVMGAVLTKEENEYIHHAGLMMYYMQALRFLTDYLLGDVYYHIGYAEQNYDRALNQFTVLKDLEAMLVHTYNYDPARLPEK